MTAAPMTDECPGCDHGAHPATDCLAPAYDENGEPHHCGCGPRCSECRGWGKVVTPDQREHTCHDCRGTGEAA